MKKSLFLLSAAALALASCSQEEVLDINTSKVDNNVITFRPRTGKASRSLDITTENLQSFKVLAFKGSMDGLEEGDAPREQYWPDWVEFKRVDNPPYPYLNLFKSDTPFYYPADGWNLHFVAYAPTSLTGVSADGLGKIKLANYTVKENINEQEDLVFAAEINSRVPQYEPEEENPDGAISLSFEHALTKVFISEIMNSNKNYSYKIAGVRFGNIHNTGSYTYTVGGHDLTDPTVNHEWTYTEEQPQTDKVEYTFDSPIELDEEGNFTQIMKGIERDDENNFYKDGAFMLLPQALQTDMVNPDDVEGYDKEKNPHFGPGMSYIALLVRITYNWTVDGVAKTDLMYPFKSMTKEDNGLVEIDGETYAWAAFPISTEWGAGRYVDYKIDFSNGAGFVAPGTGYGTFTDETGWTYGEYVGEDEDGNDIWNPTRFLLDYTPIFGKEVKLWVEVFDWNSGVNDNLSTDEDGAPLSVPVDEYTEDDFFGKPKK